MAVLVQPRGLLGETVVKRATSFACQGARALVRVMENRMKRILILVLGVLVLLSLVGPQAAARAVAATPSGIVLTSNVPSPQPVGIPITWTAHAVDHVPLL